MKDRSRKATILRAVESSLRDLRDEIDGSNISNAVVSAQILLKDLENLEKELDKRESIANEHVENQHEYNLRTARLKA